MRSAFVISPIGRPCTTQRDNADEVLNMFIRPAAKNCGFAAYRGDDVSLPGMIVQQICDSILRDSLLFAYLKDGNPNVYYELAIAQTLRTPVVLLKDPEDVIPFGIGAQRVISLDRTDINATRQKIEQQIRFLTHPTNSIESPVVITPDQVLESTMPRTHAGASVSIDPSGIWTGFTVQSFPPGSDAAYQTYHAEMQLSCVGRYVTGTVFIAYGDDFAQPAQNTAVLRLHGTVRPPRFVRLHYDNERLDHHCGILFLEITPGGRDAAGAFAGYGIASGQPVHGKLTMRRTEQGGEPEPPMTRDLNS